MASRTLVYRKSGEFLDELDVLVRRGWLQAEKAEASFLISTSDEKCTETNLDVGNILVVTHDYLPPWIGTIEQPRTWTMDAISVVAKTPEHLLEFRITENGTVISGTPGVRFRQLLALANNDGDARFVEGAIYDDGRARGNDIGGFTLLDCLINLQASTGKDGGFDWSFEPFFDTRGQVSIAGNWFRRRGLETDLVLTEDNTEMPLDSVLTEHGLLVNWVKVTPTAVTRASESRDPIVATDEKSVGRFGLRQNTLSVESGAQSVGEAHINQHSQLKRVFSLAAVDQVGGEPANGDVFRQLRLGNEVGVKLAKVGFGPYGLGTDTRARITGMEFGDDPPRVMLSLEEIVE